MQSMTVTLGRRVTTYNTWQFMTARMLNKSLYAFIADQDVRIVARPHLNKVQNKFIQWFNTYTSPIEMSI